MGKKGAKRTPQADAAAGRIVDDLAVLGDVTAKKMFGGYGIFGDGVMFAIVDSAGDVFFRTDDVTRSSYEEAGGMRHDRMPYNQVPDIVTSDDETMASWAREALSVAAEAKK